VDENIGKTEITKIQHSLSVARGVNLGMRIAQIAPLVEAVPPILYGGTERVVSWLTEELVLQGHEVTLFATGDSITNAELVSTVNQGLRLGESVFETLPYHVLMFETVLERADEFDVLHFHTDTLHFPLFHRMANRVVTTVHSRLDLPEVWPIYRAFPDMRLISLSHRQRQPIPTLNWLGTIYHGLPANLYQPNFHPQNYCTFLGRIAPEKGIEQAIEIAKRSQIPLKIAAKVDQQDNLYFENRVRPLLSHPLIEFIGEINEAQKTDFLGNAQMLLFPINHPEPFGLVMIEAMACGTPVIAYRHGSVPEVLDHGVTGFVVENLEDALQAVGRIPSLDRRQIRAVFESRFTAKRMAEKYVAAYLRLNGSQSTEPLSIV
jgi:glycosyltransferase involved in cell wall biosynthesis